MKSLQAKLPRLAAALKTSLENYLQSTSAAETLPQELVDKRTQRWIKMQRANNTREKRRKKRRQEEKKQAKTAQQEKTSASQPAGTARDCSSTAAPLADDPAAEPAP